LRLRTGLRPGAGPKSLQKQVGRVGSDVVPPNAGRQRYTRYTINRVRERIMERLRIKTWSRTKECPNVGLQKQIGSVGFKGRSAALDKSRQE
jgi:hypothetical protein